MVGLLPLLCALQQRAEGLVSHPCAPQHRAGDRVPHPCAPQHKAQGPGSPPQVPRGTRQRQRVTLVHVRTERWDSVPIPVHESTGHGDRVPHPCAPQHKPKGLAYPPLCTTSQGGGTGFPTLRTLARSGRNDSRPLCTTSRGGTCGSIPWRTVEKGGRTAPPLAKWCKGRFPFEPTQCRNPNLCEAKPKPHKRHSLQMVHDVVHIQHFINKCNIKY